MGEVRGTACNKASMVSLVVLAIAVLWLMIPPLWKIQHKESVIVDQHGGCACTQDVKEKVDQKCEVIHISIVCLGYHDSREVANLIKSVLFYRNNPLHFHFLSDKIARHILETLFMTWAISGVETTFYDVEQFLEDSNTIEMCDYSDPLPTLHLTQLLPDKLEKVIVLDTKVVLTSDIAELWQQFDYMADTKAIAIVEKAKQHLSQKKTFDIGVMLLNLTKLRGMDWMKLLEASCPEKVDYTHLEQEVINTAISRHPNLIHVLPCTWNLQLEEDTSDKYCVNELSDLTRIKVIQWRLPIQSHQFPKVSYFEYVDDLYSTLLDFNGNFLRRKAYRCAQLADKPADDQLDENDVCFEFRKHALLKYRTHLHVSPFNYTPKPDGYDVTLISHLTIDRLRMLKPLLRHWKGPVGFALYLTDSEIQPLLEFINGSDELKNRENIAFHVVYKNGPYYPTNYLKHVAEKEANTPYIFTIDVDCIPRHGLYEYLRESISALILQSTPLKALIVPGFEFHTINLLDDNFPESKAEVISLLEAREILTFNEFSWPPSHKQTNFTKWQTATSPYTVSYVKLFEPYMVLQRDLSYYDKHFVGVVGDRHTYTFALHIQGFEFIVLPDAFTIHYPHYEYDEYYEFKTDYLTKLCVTRLIEELESTLIQKYGA